MNANEIETLAKENETVEYKSAKGGFPKSFWETFSAFANTNGGVIILGVKETNGRYVADGLTEGQIQDYKKKFWDDAHNKNCVSVPLLVEDDVEAVTLQDGSFLLVFRVPRAAYNLRPVYLTTNPIGHTYRRRHEGDYVCSDDEVRQMFSDANHLRSSADARILRNYTMDDIDMATLRNYRQVYDSRHEGHPWSEVDDKTFLENIGAFVKTGSPRKKVSPLRAFSCLARRPASPTRNACLGSSPITAKDSALILELDGRTESIPTEHGKPIFTSFSVECCHVYTMRCRHLSCFQPMALHVRNTHQPILL